HDGNAGVVAEAHGSPPVGLGTGQGRRSLGSRFLAPFPALGIGSWQWPSGYVMCKGIVDTTFSWWMDIGFFGPHEASTPKLPGGTRKFPLPSQTGLIVLRRQVVDNPRALSAGVAELADARDLGSRGETRTGSSPVARIQSGGGPWGWLFPI